MERRAYRRIPSNIQVKIFHSNAIFFGSVKNLSENGMYISTRKIFCPEGSQIEVSIPFNSKELDVPVIVRRLEETEGLHNGIGVELLEHHPEYSDLIRAVEQ